MNRERCVADEIEAAIIDFPLPEQGDPKTLLHKMVLSYLVHYGYSQTAKLFATKTNQPDPSEDMCNFLKISELVMSGEIRQAIEQTKRLRPGLLENNDNLLFMLKFVEMINRTGVENHNELNDSCNSDTTTAGTGAETTATTNATNSGINSPNTTITINNAQNLGNNPLVNEDNADINTLESLREQCSISNDAPTTSGIDNKKDYLDDGKMENNGHAANDVLPSVSSDFERIRKFGKDILKKSEKLKSEYKLTNSERKIIEDALSSFDYLNRGGNRLSSEFCHTKRETVRKALHAAILESMNYSRLALLEYRFAHADQLIKVMRKANIGEADYLDRIFRRWYGMLYSTTTMDPTP